MAAGGMLSYGCHWPRFGMGRLVSQEELTRLEGREARGPRRIVFTNGCFDLLHPGHLRCLEYARSLGDALVVGLNSDASVRAVKGGATGVERPLMPEAERAELLAALAVVDYVVIFDEPTPRELIAMLLPDVLAKGADWGANEIVGRAEVEAAGGRVAQVPLESGYSTTEILRMIRVGTPSGTDAAEQ
jgi:rfaE bifunctional protein nucleotidyltransferase chain/domain